MMRVELQRLSRRVFGLLLVLLLPLAFLLQLTSLSPPLYDQHRRKQSAAQYGASHAISRSEDVGPRRDATDGLDDDDTPSVPSPSLIPLLDDINILIVTDVHSWVASHAPHDHDGDDGYLNADYGTVLSFFERLRRLCQSRRHDLFFVNNGDYVDGTGLSRDPPDQLVKILEAMPWDAVNVGNHELHYPKTMEAASRRPGGLIDALGGRYLTSNVVWRDTGEPVGSRYRFLKGGRTTLLTFGFIYEYEYPAHACEVEKVADAVRSDWFVDVVSGKEGGSFDAVLVLAHMDVSDPLVSVILGAIRGLCGEGMRVLFVTGHTHIRGYEMLDGRSVSVEAGKYLDTVGFVSFSVETPHAKNTAKDSSAFRDTNVEAVVATSGRDEAALKTAGTAVDRSNATAGMAAGENLPDAAGFRHAFLDANFDVLRDALDDETRNANLTTANGQRLSDLIRTTYSSMGLNDLVGCAPRTYLVNTTIAKLDDENSLWGLYFNEVVPTQLLKNNASKIFVQDGGGLRYDLHEGIVTVGDVIAASPINDTILLVAERVEGRALSRVFDDHPDLYFWGTGDGEVVADDGLYDVISVEFDAYMLAPALGEVLNRTVEPRTMGEETKNRTQIDLWTDYITERWECPPTPSPTSSSSSTNTAAGAIDTHATYSEEERVQMALGVVAAVLYGVCLAAIYWIVLCFTWRIGGSRPPPGERTWLAPRCRYKVCTKKGASGGDEDDDDPQTRCHNDDEGGGRIGQGSVKDEGGALREIT